MANLWPTYQKQGERSCRDVKSFKDRKTQHLRYHKLSRTFTSMHSWSAWGARGREFESRRPDQFAGAAPSSALSSVILLQRTGHSAGLQQENTMNLRSFAAAGFLAGCLAAGLTLPLMAAAAERGKLNLPS